MDRRLAPLLALALSACAPKGADSAPAAEADSAADSAAAIDSADTAPAGPSVIETSEDCVRLG